jgi:hypothetical protein
MERGKKNAQSVADVFIYVLVFLVAIGILFFIFWALSKKF